MAARRLRELVPDNADPVEGYPGSDEVLRLLRESQLHRPDLVLKFAPKALTTLSSRRTAYWDTQEQLARAAAELGAWDVLRVACGAITARFAPGRSSRSALTHGLRREARGNWDSAMRTYIEILADDPTCVRAYARQVAVLKATRKLPEAIAQLNHYLSYYSTDAAAWSELCALCLVATRTAHALYAANELVLCDPNNHAAHTLVADVLMTSGTPMDMLQARKHYAASLSARRRGNLRALYGLWYAATALENTSAPSKDERAKNTSVLQWARSAINAEYEKLPNAASYAFVKDVIDAPLFGGR